MMIESTYTVPESTSNKKPGSGIVEVVDKFFAKEKLTLKRFLKCFKALHRRRVGAKMTNNGSLERPKSQNAWMQNKEIKRNKSMSKVLPKDNRRYNGQNMQELAMSHTFKPKSTAPKTKKLAENYNKKIRDERSKSRQ